MRRRSYALLIGGVLAVTLSTSSEAKDPVSLAELMRRFALSAYPSQVPAPQFVSCCHAGQAISLAGLRGKVVLLTFWATWCAECREEMPAFERLHRELAPQGLRILGVNVREKKEKIKGYARKLGLTFPLLSDRNGSIRAAYGVVGIPTTFLVNREGLAAALAVGSRKWHSPVASEVLERLLAWPLEP